MIEESKVTIIYSEDNLQRNIKDGGKESRGDIYDGNLYHTGCLLELAHDKYPDKEIFKKLNYRHRPETIGFFFTLFGNILFLNTTKNVKKYGKMGMFMMPKVITEAQKQTLMSLVPQLQDFSISILYDLKIVDGILSAKEMSAMKPGDLESVLQMYMEESMENSKSGVKNNRK